MYISKLFFGVTLLVMLTGCSGLETDGSNSFSYEGAIRDVAAISDRHALVLERCLEQWDYESGERLLLSSKIRGDVISGGVALLVEFGGSSHAAYDYIYVT